ncbi:F0F1 ATP synthase subunit delta [Devosia sp. ZB163]|uniref:F0F1 ATP synthase subunit delta n=1 Tax=Devosia sp. ZB163 TaxID=3025938 RepID=UPI0023604F50|nr:F0F1 ATP synthase subunit delta [Devosia sp. ZB163]MDC9822127.1 F0F1 ATP synthase subunit delta [Devosia sp. ZB163]
MAAQDSVLSQIARPYAAALFELAEADKSVAAVEQGLDKLLALAEENIDFARFLRSPVINTEEKAQAMHAVLERAKAHTTVGNFVKVVARNGRLFALPAIVAAFKERAAAHRGEVTADVTSAVALSAAQAKALADTLKAKIGKSVTLNQHVDSSLIGGLVVKVGSQMIDSSLKTKLTAMKIAMKEVG